MNRKGNGSDRRVLYTKMFLKESLLSLMEQKPAAKIPVSELCRHAEINRNTFYTHYRSVEDLLSEIEKDLYDQIKEAVDHSWNHGSVALLLEDLFAIFLANQDFCKVLFQKNYDHFLQKMFEMFYEQAVTDWKILGQHEDRERLDMLYAFLSGSWLAVIRSWVLGEIKESPHELALLIEKANYFGLSSFMKA